MNRRGFTLLEAITYVLILTVVLTLAYPAFHKCQRGSRDLQRNANDILQTVRAGERWRQDVRAATGPIRVEAGIFVIPQRTGNITYSVTSNQLRRTAGERKPITVLTNVKTTTMQTDRRELVTAYRWDVELISHVKTTRVRPQFSFVAVPDGGRP